jgi:hypothetical protein
MSPVLFAFCNASNSGFVAVGAPLVNRATARFILRSRSAGSKGRPQLASMSTMPPIPRALSLLNLNVNLLRPALLGAFAVDVQFVAAACFF